MIFWWGSSVEPNAANGFLPWFRRDAATLITYQPRDPKAPDFQPVERPIFHVKLKFDGVTPDVERDVALYGPGEVIGFDGNAVTRVQPARGVLEAEPESLAHIEFDQPDLPWRYTAAAPGIRHVPRESFPHFEEWSGFRGHVFWQPFLEVPTDRLQPWIVLIVLRPDEIDIYRPPSNTRPLASVTVKSISSLPNLAQSWAWAHVQATGSRELTPEEALRRLAEEPHTLISRILCPRRLTPRTAWRAFLVPAFERGRRAGLGQPTVDTVGENFVQDIPVDALRPAWGPDSRALEFPIYYEWEFGTGDENCDFEALAKRLTARPLPPDVGTRTIDVSAIDPALPSASASPFPIAGALRSPAIAMPPPDAPFVTAMTNLLNTPAAVLPLYGRWHAGRTSVSASTPWLAAANTNPRHRAAAGAGAQVVHQHEDKLLAASWQQIEGLPEINEQLRTAQLARAIGTRMYERRLRTATIDAFLMLTAPLFRRIPMGPRTLAALVAASRMGRAPFEPAFRRLLRRLAGPSAAVVARWNAGQLVPAPDPPQPVVVANPAAVTLQGVLQTPPRPSFKLVPEVGPGHPPPTPTPPGSGGTDSLDAAAFRDAARDMLDALRDPFPVLPPRPALDLAAMRAAIEAAAAPADAVAQRLLHRLRIAPDFPRAAADPLEPILAAPSFDDPMYEPLAELSQEWILPGVAALPANTITLALSHQRFIEAFMLGLTHELNRLLLWRGYPTDQRASYFRQFWDSRGYFGPHDEESLRDVEPLETWPPASALSANSSRPPLPGNAEPLVLVLRGDLLRQYPTAVVYATRAAIVGGQHEPLDPPQEKHPIFRGRLDPDLTFFGFELTVEEARGQEDGSDAGWFFVLQEQSSEVRFGLNAGPAGEPDVAWYADESATAAQIAATALRRPVRVMRHASLMLAP